MLLYIVCVFFFLMIRRPPRSTRTAHSFPTRRSSDLNYLKTGGYSALRQVLEGKMDRAALIEMVKQSGLRGRGGARSEEHTSELQSLMRISYAVFCLKKKNKTKNAHYLNRSYKQYRVEKIYINHTTHFTLSRPD